MVFYIVKALCRQDFLGNNLAVSQRLLWLRMGQYFLPLLLKNTIDCLYN